MPLEGLVAKISGDRNFPENGQRSGRKNVVLKFSKSPGYLARSSEHRCYAVLMILHLNQLNFIEMRETLGMKTIKVKSRIEIHLYRALVHWSTSERIPVFDVV